MLFRFVTDLLFHELFEKKNCPTPKPMLLGECAISTTTTIHANAIASFVVVVLVVNVVIATEPEKTTRTTTTSPSRFLCVCLCVERRQRAWESGTFAAHLGHDAHECASTEWRWKIAVQNTERTAENCSRNPHSIDEKHTKCKMCKMHKNVTCLHGNMVSLVNLLSGSLCEFILARRKVKQKRSGHVKSYYCKTCLWRQNTIFCYPFRIIIAIIV